MKSINIFIGLLEENNIKCDIKKFFNFCNKVAFFNFNEDRLFYEYNWHELKHRSNYTIKTLFKKFNDWNNDIRFFRVFENDDPQKNYSVIQAKTANQAKSIYSRQFAIEYIECKAFVSYSDCL